MAIQYQREQKNSLNMKKTFIRVLGGDDGNRTRVQPYSQTNHSYTIGIFVTLSVYQPLLCVVRQRRGL